MRGDVNNYQIGEGVFCANKMLTYKIFVGKMYLNRIAHKGVINTISMDTVR